MLRKNFLRVVVLGYLILVHGCVPVTKNSKSPGKIQGAAGRVLPYYSISIDANYDNRLDQVFPGYKLLPVLIKNVSLKAIPMDVKTDRWVIVSEKGKHYRAINSLKVKDPVAWRDVPEKMRNIIDYPEIIPINYTVTFDLLVPSIVPLEYFSQIRYYNATLNQKFVVEKEY